jgi:hypothetical protein
MSITKQTSIDSVEISENNIVHVRTITRILEGEQLLSSSLSRHVIAPGDDYSNDDAKVKAICSAVHTADVVAAYEAAQTAQTNVAQPE